MSLCKRVVEGQPARLPGAGVSGRPAGKVVCAEAVACKVGGAGLWVHIGQQHQVLHAGQLAQHLAQHRPAVVCHAAPHLAVHRHQHLGRDLPEAVEHGHRAHVGAAHAPDRAHAGAGQKGDHGVRRVGQVGAHPVAGFDTRGLQLRGEGAHLALEFGPVHLHRLGHAFVLEHDGRVAGGVGRIGVAQRLARVVQLCTGKPARAWHAGVFKHRLVGRGRLDVEEVPHALPEGRQVGDAPAPERVITVELQAPFTGQPVGVGGDARRAHLAMHEGGVHGATLRVGQRGANQGSAGVAARLGPWRGRAITDRPVRR